MDPRTSKELNRLVHVIALAALHQEEGTHKIKAKKELKKYAFPEEIKIDEEI
tara:strand:- start:366 stop:521 length:156 start_codon:yes stop_codon:yes gene_type:complete